MRTGTPSRSRARRPPWTRSPAARPSPARPRPGPSRSRCWPARPSSWRRRRPPRPAVPSCWPPRRPAGSPRDLLRRAQLVDQRLEAGQRSRHRHRVAVVRLRRRLRLRAVELLLGAGELLLGLVEVRLRTVAVGLQRQRPDQQGDGDDHERAADPDPPVARLLLLRLGSRHVRIVLAARTHGNGGHARHTWCGHAASAGGGDNRVAELLQRGLAAPVSAGSSSMPAGSTGTCRAACAERALDRREPRGSQPQGPPIEHDRRVDERDRRR